MAEEVTITGLDEVLTNLKKLDDKMQTKVFKKATKAGAKIVLNVAIAAAPVGSGLDPHPGLLRDNLRIRSMSKPSKGITRSMVGVGAKDWTGEAFYASFVLWGHKTGSRKSTDRKEVPANNFLKRSVDVAGEGAANVMIATIKEGIESANG